VQYKIFKAVVSSSALDLIQEVLSSNLNFDTGYPERLFVVFFSLSRYMPHNALLRPSPFSSKSLSIYQSLFILGENACATEKENVKCVDGITRVCFITMSFMT
jgi:hypothetical protein